MPKDWQCFKTPNEHSRMPWTFNYQYHLSMLQQWTKMSRWTKLAQKRQDNRFFWLQYESELWNLNVTVNKVWCRIEVINVSMDKTSWKWLTVGIFQKWQDSSAALWIEIPVILNWRLDNWFQANMKDGWMWVPVLNLT